MEWFVNGALDEVEIGVFVTGDESVTIMFGTDLIGLEFGSVKTLERLRDAAAEGAAGLRAVVEASEQARVEEAKPGAAGGEVG